MHQKLLNIQQQLRIAAAVNGETVDMLTSIPAGNSGSPIIAPGSRGVAPDTHGHSKDSGHTSSKFVKEIQKKQALVSITVHNTLGVDHFYMLP